MASNDDNRYTIDPNRFRTYWCYLVALVLFWIVWACSTVFASLMAIAAPDPFLFVWLAIAWTLTLFMPFNLVLRKRKQALEIVGDELIVRGTGMLPNHCVRIAREDLHALTLELYGESDPESVYSLNLLHYRGHWLKRTMLAQFVHWKNQPILFDEIRAFLTQHGLELEYKNELAEQDE